MAPAALLTGGALVVAGLLGVGSISLPASGVAVPYSFSTGNPDGLMAVVSQPSSSGVTEIEAADDFVVTNHSTVSSATFIGLLPTGDTVSDIAQVGVEIYRVFPLDSTNPPSGNVPTRVNSPSDVAFAERSTGAATATFSASVLAASFTTNNSVHTGVHPSPNQTTGGEGAVTGQEVSITVTFTTPIDLPADHYDFVPQVGLGSGKGAFSWLSATRPIVAPGTPFSPDLQMWVRDENLAPDWLRVGTDIVGGEPAPTFNGTFSLTGEEVPDTTTTTSTTTTSTSTSTSTSTTTTSTSTTTTSTSTTTVPPTSAPPTSAVPTTSGVAAVTEASAPPAGAAPDALPSTGVGHAVPLGAVGAGLLAAGTVLLAVRRRAKRAG